MALDANKTVFDYLRVCSALGRDQKPITLLPPIKIPGLLCTVQTVFCLPVVL